MKRLFQRAAAFVCAALVLFGCLAARAEAADPFAVLLIGVSVISFSIRALVNNYMLQKTDTQLSSQSQLVVNNIDLLSKNDSSGPNSYFLQIQYTDGTKDKEGNPLVVTPLISTFPCISPAPPTYRVVHKRLLVYW